MQRSDNPLNNLFDAARQEQSPLSEDDVRALLNQPQKKNRRPIMLPMLIAGAIITVAGITSSVLLVQDNATPSIAQSQSSATTSSTPALKTNTSTATLSATTSTYASATTDAPAKKVVVQRRLVREVAPAEQVWWTSGPEGVKNALCHVKPIYPTMPANTLDKAVKVYFATVIANREVTDKLAEFGAPVPVLCTDTRGRACSKSDVTYFASNFDAIAGDLNDLVPVTYAGREDILAWYIPSAELVQAFPDSLQDELVTLLDIDIDLEFDMPPDAPFKMNKFGMNDSTMQSFKIQMQSLDSNMTRYHFNMKGNLDSMVMLMGQFSPDEYSEMKDPHNEMMKLSANTRAHIDSTMKLLYLKLAIDSMTVLPKEFLELRDVQVDSLPSNKKVYNFKRKINLDSTGRYGDPKGKQRFQRRIVIKSTTKRNKNAPVLPSVEKLSELTPTSNGAIASTSVYPNPATNGGATMRYVLNEPRTLKLTLLDLNGAVVATIVQDGKRASGDGQIEIPLSNIPAGMYIVTLTTDKSERAMQRLVVQ